MKRWPSPTVPTCCSRVKSSRRVRPRSWLPTRWCARSIWDSISNCGAVRRSTNSARDSPRTQPKRIRPRRNRPYPPSVGQCPADRPRGIRPTPAYDGTNPDRNPEPFSACGKRPFRQNRELRNEVRKGLRTHNRFRERIPKKNEQTTIFEHRFASYSSRESFRLREMESETTTF